MIEMGAYRVPGASDAEFLNGGFPPVAEIQTEAPPAAGNP